MTRTRPGRRLPVTAAVAGIVVAGVIVVPFVVPDPTDRLRVAEALCLLAAASGLAAVVGLAGVPSLAQGAFMGIGAYSVAVARTHFHAGPLLAGGAAVALATGAGVLVAWASGRAHAAAAALTTWLVAWLFVVVVDAFPNVTGGARGLIVPPARQHVGVLGVTVTAGARGVYFMAAACAALALGAFAALRHRYGPAFAALRADPVAAAVAGVPVVGLRRGAIVLSAVIAGAAGAIHVQAAGVADPTAYGPLLSVTLLIAVLVGGSRAVAGPAVGLVALVAVSRLAGGITGVVGGSRAALEPVAAAVLLVPVLLAGGRGLLRPPRRRSLEHDDGKPPETRPALPAAGAELVAEHISVVFGGIVALDDVDLRVRAGTCHALVGANGSGKSTLLKVLAGAITPAAGGVVSLDSGRPARTLQRLAVADDMTVLDHVVSGGEPARPTGPVRALLATPMSRADTRQAETRAAAILELVGLGGRGHLLAGELDAADRRLVQIGRALACKPSILLLDEPAAGLGVQERRRMVEVLARCRAAGLTLVLVEHHGDVVTALADDVTVLAAGRVADRAPGAAAPA